MHKKGVQSTFAPPALAQTVMVTDFQSNGRQNQTIVTQPPPKEFADEASEVELSPEGAETIILVQQENHHNHHAAIGNVRYFDT